jgi:hypothetical protein
MANTATTDREERPYKPSWIDRFTDWVERLPVPGWVFYMGLGLALVLVQVLFLWLDGGLIVAGQLLPVMVFNALFTAFPPALIHVLDNQAVSALHTMKPTLKVTKARFDDLRYRLSTMPARATLIAGLFMLIFAILMEQLWIAPIRFAALEQVPIFAVVFHIVDKTPALMLGALFYHTIRQLRLVNTIHANHTRVSLFNLGPLRAFSQLTASTAMGLVVGIYAWMLINPELLADPLSIGFVGLFSVLAVAVFVWPLWSAHRLMEIEKARMLHEVDLHSQTVFSEFNQLLSDGDHTALERLNRTISSLEIQHRRISAIPTWPWRPETARVALSAIALPLVLTILQLLLQQALGW